MELGSLPQFLSAEPATTAVAQVWRGAAWCGMVRRGTGMRIPHAEMSRLLPHVVAYLHTPQICGLFHGVKVGIRRISNWTAEK
jgi:hypothetical protein